MLSSTKGTICPLLSTDTVLVTRQDYTGLGLKRRGPMMKTDWTRQNCNEED